MAQLSARKLLHCSCGRVALSAALLSRSGCTESASSAKHRENGV